MNTFKSKPRKQFCILACSLIFLLAILMIIVGIQYNNLPLFISLAIPLIIGGGLFLFFYLKYICENKKQLLVKDCINAFKYDYYYGKSLEKTLYTISKDEFQALKFSDGNDFEIKNLVVGDRNYVDFRSADIQCGSFKGRVYALNLQAAKDYQLYATVDKEYSLEELNFEKKGSPFRFYTNNVKMTSSIFKTNSLERLIALNNSIIDNLLITIVNGSLYIGKPNDDKAFDEIENSKMLLESVVAEYKFIEDIIDCFRFAHAKPKIKEMIIK